MQDTGRLATMQMIVVICSSAELIAAAAQGEAADSMASIQVHPEHAVLP